MYHLKTQPEVYLSTGTSSRLFKLVKQQQQQGKQHMAMPYSLQRDLILNENRPQPAIKRYTHQQCTFPSGIKSS